MALLTRELIASYAFIERNFFLTKRYWGWEIAWLVYATASALAIAFIGVEQGDQRLVLMLMIGAVFWNFLSIVFGFIAETVAWERWEGTLEYTFMAPVRRCAAGPSCWARRRTRSSTGSCTPSSCSSCCPCSSAWI